MRRKEEVQAYGDLEALLASIELAILVLDRELRVHCYTARTGTLFTLRAADRGRPLSHLTCRLEYSGLEDDAQQVLRTLVPIERESAGPDGTWFLVRLSPYRTVDDRVDGVVLTFRDTTHSKQAQEALRETQRTHELERRHQIAQGLHDILVILNSNQTADEILDYILAQACRLLEAPVGAIYRVDSEAGKLEMRASRGLDAHTAALKLPADQGALGEAVSKRQPVAVFDTTSISGQDSDSPLPERLSRLTSHYRALLTAPLLVKDAIYGAIVFFYHESRAFSAEDIRLAAMLSDQAALAIENARLLAAAQGKAVLDERQRLARDLHDSVTQALFGMTLYAEAARRLLSSGELAMATDHLRELHDTAQEALQEMRLLIFELRPPVLDQEGLRAALRGRLEAVEGRSNLETRLNVELERRLPAKVEQSLYRIAQEALNNVLKHAHAQHVTVSLRQEGSIALLEISDDGVGFDLASTREHGGMGLRGIAERVVNLGGRLSVQSATGAGTQVRVEVFL